MTAGESKMNVAELEYRLIYSMIVAGKSAKFAEGVMGRLLGDGSRSPLDWFRVMRRTKNLDSVLRQARSGNYTKLTQGISELIDWRINLATCQPADLEKIHGIGPKTSRFFILWTRPDAVHAALDTHVLKWLSFICYAKVPRSTPTGAKYKELEEIFIAQAKARGVTPAKLDSRIWEWCSSANHRVYWETHKKPESWPHDLQRR